MLFMNIKRNKKQKYYLIIAVNDLLSIPLVNALTRFGMASNRQKLQICSSILHIETTQSSNMNHMKSE